MFTDIVGYTAMVKENEVDARTKRTRYRQILEEAHQQFSGTIIQHLGDGSLSLFESSLHAVRCAVAMQQSFRSAPSIDVRIGLHAGEVVVDDEGVFGDTVNLAARVESFSVPGAILISDFVERQVRSHPSVQVQSMGTFRLKHVEHPVELYAVAGENVVVPDRSALQGKGVASAAVDLRLPRLQSELLGRDQEVAEIKQLIAQRSLVTLTGPGGTGKTSLAIKVAEDLAHTFRDGVGWVAMSEVTVPDSAILAISRTLEIPQDPSSDLTRQVIDYLAPRETLLILDNFEQIVAAASLVQQIMAACPRLKFLITSRIVLNITGEQEFTLTPLPVPLLNGNNTAERIGSYPSVRLFAERARAIQPAFTLDDHNAQDVAMICKQLDGLPLAIELAAARIKLFSPASLVRRLDRHLDIFKSDRIDRPSRHQTLREMIAWSYDLLPDRERQLFQCLAVFSGGATLDAIETVCFAADERFDAIDLVLALVNKSLLQKSEDVTGEPRFTLLRTIRSFAREQLEQSGTGEGFRAAHLTYFMEKAERIQPRLTGADAHTWYDLLETDLDNFREAMYNAVTLEKADRGFRIAAALCQLWTHRGMLSEGIRHYHQLLELHTPDTMRSDRIRVMEALGVTHFYTNRYLPAVEIFRETLAYWREQGDRHKVARTLNHLGFACGNSGLMDEGTTYTREALAMYREDDVVRGQSVSHNNLGWISMYRGQPAEALAHFEESLRLREQTADTAGVGFQLINLAWALGPMGRYDEAMAVFERAFTLLHAEDRVVWYWGLLLRANQLLEMQRLDEFGAQMASSDQWAVVEAQSPTAVAHFLRGMWAFVQGDHGQALHEIEEGKTIVDAQESPFYKAEGLLFETQVALAAGDPRRATRAATQAIAIHHDHGCQLGLARGCEQAALISLHYDHCELAGLLLRKAAGMRAALNAPVTPFTREVLVDA
ncbi:MAG: tetratricopeptide repeat protein, partial [Saprospiraceae bacterium]|nr:tetratricopeptide repeat protein [Saprospiraceae bacterium]